MSPFLQALDSGVVIGDGATGTELLARGAEAGRPLAELNRIRPDLVLAVHRSHAEAGARVLRTNTFLAGPDFDLNLAGARIAREASAGKGFVLGSMGPRGSDAVAYEAQGRALREGGCDGLCLETFTDGVELAVAAGAIRKAGLPIVALAASERALEALASIEADVVGVNCVEPALAMRALERLRPVVRNRLAAFPSAGPPAPAEFAEAGVRLAGLGARLLGGCCGATPDHVRALKGRVP